MSEKQNEEKNDNFQKINDNIDNNENKYSKKIINIFENKIEKDDINFDSIDFNINPFKEQKLEDKEQKSESDELVLEEKEDEKFEFNNIQLNSKFHTSNELLKVNFFQEDDEKGKGKKSIGLMKIEEKKEKFVEIYDYKNVFEQKKKIKNFNILK